MPELPEVETTRKGIAPHVLGRKIQAMIIRERRLRWPIPPALPDVLLGQTVESLKRRGKYLIFSLPQGTLILHLGMSGSLRIVTREQPAEKHDHFDIVFDNSRVLRYRDPRRFGACIWTEKPPLQHKLLAQLGPEPLDREFDGTYLKQRAKGKKLAIKNFIMDSRTVVGVGNIYANEALFNAGIRPGIAAGRISAERYRYLAQAIKDVLRQAIKAGGTSLRDFTQSDGNPGYFKQKLSVYGRANMPCMTCGTTIKLTTIGQRASYYCPQCQQ